MSDFATSWRKSSWPASSRRLSVTVRLFRPTTGHQRDVPSVRPHCRIGSPVPGASTLITSAPWSAISVAANGPASSWPASSTRTPASGPEIGPAVGSAVVMSRIVYQICIAAPVVRNAESALVQAEMRSSRRQCICIGADSAGSAGGGALGVVRVVALDPRHQLAQLATGLLDRVLLALLAELGELRRAVVHVADEALGELAVLDVREDVLHVLLHVGRDDARAGDVVAELGGVGDRPALLGDAAFVHQVDDQLQLVEALEVRDLGLVAGLGEDLEAVHDELRGATAEHGLLTEQVGLGLLGERGLDAAGAQAADGLGVRQGQRPGVARLVLLHGDEDGDAAAVDVLTTDQVAGALRGDHEDVDALGRGDVAEADVEAVAEDQGVAGGELGGDLLGVQLPLVLIGSEDDDDVGLLRGLGRGEDAQALGLGLRPTLGARLQADAHVDARVAQGQRMGVALAAVADDRDVLALDQGQVGVVVVEHLSHWGFSFVLVWCFSPRSWWGGDGDRAQVALGDGTGAAADGDHAGLHQLTDAEGLQHAQQVAQLVGVADGLDGDGVGGDVDDLRPEELYGVEHLTAGLRIGLDLDEQQLAVDRGRAVELDDLADLHQLVELLGHLLERRALDVDHDRHPGHLGVLGRTDREGVDVEAAAAEQAGDPGEHARLVLDQDRQRVLGVGRRTHGRSSRSASSSNRGARSRAYLMSSLPVPAATIGQTIASRCTRKSTTTGTSLISIALLMVASTSSGLSHARPTQP